VIDPAVLPTTEEICVRCDGQVEMSAERADVPAKDLAASTAFPTALGSLGVSSLPVLQPQEICCQQGHS